MTKTLLNPYIAGAPVVENSMFFGREEVFGWIERSLAGKFVDHILVLHGQRRVGKTSVLKQIPNYLPDKYVQVFFDLQGRTNTTLDRFLWWLAREISRTLKAQRGLDIPRPSREDFAKDTELLINDFLPGLRSLLQDEILLLTFDEFDTLDRADIQDTLARPLIAYLRRMMEIDGLNFIFSIGSSGNKLENMQASYTDFFKAALYRKVSFLSLADTRNLVTRPVAGVLEHDPAAVDRIYEITSGHPYFSQLTCHELFSLCQKTGARSISKADVDSVIDDVIERGTVNLKFVWDEASSLEKWVIACLAQMDGLWSMDRLAEILREQRVRFSEADLNSAIIHLRDKDVLDEQNRFIIHLMQLWLRRNRPLDRVREELVEVNPIANRYIEIGDEYRDLEQSQEAIDSYEQALAVQPGNLKAQVNIGAVHQGAKAYAEAVAAYEKALQIDNEDVAALTGLCDANLALGDTAREKDAAEEAIGHYQQVLIINPSHTDARERLAAIYHARAEARLKEEQDDEALSAFAEALKYTPEDLELAARYEDVLEGKKARVIASWLGKAERAEADQRWEDAIAAIEEALKIAPEDPELETRLAAARQAPRNHQLGIYKRTAADALKTGDWDTAIAAIQSAAELAPDQPEWGTRLTELQERKLNAQLAALQENAEAAVQTGRWDDAISAIQNAVELAPDQPEWGARLIELREGKLNARLAGYQERADRAVDSNNWGAAIEAMAAAIQLAPDQPEWKEKLAAIQKQKLDAQLAELQAQSETAAQAGNWDAAIKAVREAIQLAPDQPQWSARLAEIETHQLEAQIDDFTAQSIQAEKAGDWEAAIGAVQQALQLAPERQKLQARLTALQAAQRQAQLDGYRQQAEKARKAGKWVSAITALEAYLAIDPENAGVIAEIAAIQEEKRALELVEFKAQAEKAVAKEEWEVAAKAWAGYLALEPKDLSEAQSARDHAQKYARISRDYGEAEKALGEKRYAQAVELLQRVVAQDAAYKSASRMLVEAVEAKSTAPVWKSPWLYTVVGGVALVLLGVFYGPALWSAVSTAFERAPAETNTPAAVVDPVETEAAPSGVSAAGMAFVADVQARIAERQPDFAEDYSSQNNATWNCFDQPEITLSEGALTLTSNPAESTAYTLHCGRHVQDFVLEFEFTPRDFNFGNRLVVSFHDRSDPETEVPEVTNIHMTTAEGFWIEFDAPPPSGGQLASGQLSLYAGSAQQNPAASGRRPGCAIPQG